MSVNMSREEFIARVRYLGWICFQMGANLPLHDVAEDYEISEERLESLINGTRFALDNPGVSAEDNHNNWVKCKQEQGYVYGKELSVGNKIHPSLIPFDKLPKVEQDKDVMDLLMVKLANDLYEKIIK